MAINKSYVSKLGADYKISDHFSLGEMRCKNGADLVLWMKELMAQLEDTRTYLGATVTINSGYRTEAYNKKIGGASSSQHCKGTAADVTVKIDGNVVAAKLICCIAQDLGFKGIGYISERSVHLDMRESGTYKGDERYGYGGNVNGDFYTYFKISKATVLAWKKNQVTAYVAAEPVDGLTPFWEKAIAAGITTGEDQKGDAKRGQVMTFIARKITGDKTLTVDAGIAYAKEHGYSTGESPDLYSTRNQVAAMIYRAKTGQKEESFDKVWAWAKEQGITDGSLQNDTATREEAVTMILRGV